MNLTTDYKKITLDGTETAVTFPRVYPVFVVKGEDILISLSANITEGADNVRSTADHDGCYIWSHNENTDTMYLKGTGEVVVAAFDSTVAAMADFKKTGEGGGGSVTLDDHVTQNSPNPVKSSGIYEALSNKQDIIQYTTMPTITAAMVRQIAQYVGATDSTYTQGYFYIASSDGAAEPTYSWVNLPVSPRTYSETVLWTNDGTTNPSTITLSSAYTNFDAIVIVHKHTEASELYTSTATYLTSAMDIDDMLGISLGDAPSLYTWYKLTAANELTISASGLLLNKIIGIKY